MGKIIEYTAKTIDEAVAQAVENLNIEKNNLKYTVLEEGKKGFLGIGAQDAKIAVELPETGTDKALQFITQVVNDMELDLKIGSHNGENDDFVITVDGDKAGLLIGHHGETLDALQYLANLAASQKNEEGKRDRNRIVLDIENYRAKREEALRVLARRMAAKVVKYKKSVMLEPMNPWERRIIHSEVQGIDGVSTNSIGAENNRRVVMFLEDTKE